MIEKDKIFSKLELGIKNTKNIRKKDLIEIKTFLEDLFKKYEFYLKL